MAAKRRKQRTSKPLKKRTPPEETVNSLVTITYQKIDKPIGDPTTKIIDEEFFDAINTYRADYVEPFLEEALQGAETILREMNHVAATPHAPGFSELPPQVQMASQVLQDVHIFRAYLKAFPLSRQQLHAVGVFLRLADNIYSLDWERRTLHAVQVFERHRRSQSRKGSLRAQQRWKSSAEVRKLVEQLAKEEDSLGDPLPPNEIWPKLYAALEEAGFSPVEKDNGRTYEFDGSRYTYNTFRKFVQSRRKSASDAAK